MSITSDFFTKYGRMTGISLPLYNPLVMLRQRDDQDIETDIVPRSRLISDLEDLSRHLWHMTTVTTADRLFRQLRHDASKERYLVLLDTYADLVGLAAVPKSYESDDEFDEGLDFKDLI